MTDVAAGYYGLVHVLRLVLFYGAVVLGVVVVADWAVRTRRISPFSGTARFFRKTVDPLMLPVERAVIRAGGKPSSAPWWSLVAVVIGGLLPEILLSWVFRLLELALLVRVVSSWLPISPYSKWVRWSVVLTDWLIQPLRRLIPPIGMMDITPLVAYLLLAWVLAPIVLSTVRRIVGA